jgi:hypothetical protein
MRVPTANVRRTKMRCATATTPVTASSPAEVDAASPATTSSAASARAAPAAAGRQRHIGGAHRNCQRTHTCKQSQDDEPDDQFFVGRVKTQGPDQDTAWRS